MKELEKLLKALANKRRLMMLKFLKQKHQASVGEIANEINLSLKATSKHLAVLRSADLVERQQTSLVVYYSLVKSQSIVYKTVLENLS